jgi:hypothetical protein
MAFHKNYKNKARKDATSQDIHTQTKDMVRHTDFSREKIEHYKKYITLFRMNPALFIKRYFEIPLFPFQTLMIFLLERSTLAYFVASRGIGKTWLIAVYCAARAVLYPQSKIVVVAKTLKQGGIILSEKLTSLRDAHPNLNREIKSIVCNANTYEAIFHNGSTIRVVPATDNARGARANFIIVEESRLVPKEILEAVIKPFLISRTPPYMMKPEYADKKYLREEGIIAYITSAYFKSEYWYTYVKSAIRRMAQGDLTANFLSLDYLLTLYHGLKSQAMLDSEFNDSSEDVIDMEYRNIPNGQSGKSYYTFSMFPRNAKRAFYPQVEDESYNDKKNPYAVKRVEGELRFISVDVATRANKANDNTIISCVRLIPMRGKGYSRHLVYMESFKGVNTVTQSKRIKEIFYDFESDYCVLDLQNAGISIFDSMSQVTQSDERGITFPAFTVVENENVDEKLKDELRTRTLGLNALPVVFPIQANQTLNAQIAVAFRNSLQKKMWSFLLPESDVEDFLIKTYKDFMTSDGSSKRAFYLNPYVQTGLLIGECVNLEMMVTNGLIKVYEKEGHTKDRYTSVSYLNYVATFFDKDLLKESDNTSDADAILEVSFVM